MPRHLVQPRGRARAALDDALGLRRRLGRLVHFSRFVSTNVLRLRVFGAADAEPMVIRNRHLGGADWFYLEALTCSAFCFRATPDLRLLLTDYGFIGIRFARHFPLSGNAEVRYTRRRARVRVPPVHRPRVIVPKVSPSRNRYDPHLNECSVAAAVSPMPEIRITR